MTDEAPAKSAQPEGRAARAESPSTTSVTSLPTTTNDLRHERALDVSRRRSTNPSPTSTAAVPPEPPHPVTPRQRLATLPRPLRWAAAGAAGTGALWIVVAAVAAVWGTVQGIRGGDLLGTLETGVQQVAYVLVVLVMLAVSGGFAGLVAGLLAGLVAGPLRRTVAGPLRRTVPCLSVARRTRAGLSTTGRDEAAEVESLG